MVFGFFSSIEKSGHLVASKVRSEKGMQIQTVATGGVTLSYVWTHCTTVSSCRTTFWWVSIGHGDGNNRKKKHRSCWCAVCGGQYELRAPDRILVMQLGANANEAKVFKAHTAPQGLCEILINALKLLANQQTHGDSPIQSIVTGLHERIIKKESWMSYEASLRWTTTVQWT